MRSLFELRPLLRQDELALAEASLAEASLAEASLADDVALPSQLSRLPVTSFDIHAAHARRRVQRARPSPRVKQGKTADSQRRACSRNLTIYMPSPSR